jgi:predicted MFS family arabinose efflux permease
MNRDIDVNSLSAVLSAIALGTLGVLSFIIQPAIVQGFVTHLKLSEPQAVNLVGLEMLGVALSTILLALPHLKIDWRLALVAGLVIAIGGNIGSAVLVGSDSLWIARLIAGFGHGIIISLSFTFIGLTVRVDRNLAWFLVALLSYGAIGLWIMPSLLDHIGMSGLFLSFAALLMTGFVTLGFVPRSNTALSDLSPSTGSPTAKQLTLPFLITALAAVLAYNIAQGIAWAILFLIGIDAGLAEQPVANALFISQVFAIFGALGSVFLGGRIGRYGPIFVGIFAGAACMVLLLDKPLMPVFLVGVCGFNLLWNFVLPYILGAVSDFDGQGRMMGPAIAMQMLGLGGGPLLAAQLIEHSSYFVTLIIAIGFFILSYVLLIIPMLRHGRLGKP